MTLLGFKKLLIESDKTEELQTLESVNSSFDRGHWSLSKSRMENAQLTPRLQQLRDQVINAIEEVQAEQVPLREWPTSATGPSPWIGLSLRARDGGSKNKLIKIQQFLETQTHEYYHSPAGIYVAFNLADAAPYTGEWFLVESGRHYLLHTGGLLALRARLVAIIDPGYAADEDASPLKLLKMGAEKWSLPILTLSEAKERVIKALQADKTLKIRPAAKFVEVYCRRGDYVSERVVKVSLKEGAAVTNGSSTLGKRLVPGAPQSRTERDKTTEWVIQNQN